MSVQQLLGVVNFGVVVNRLVVLVCVEDYYRLSFICPHESDILIFPVGNILIVYLNIYTVNAVIPFGITSSFSFAVFIWRVLKIDRYH